jgi:hypothetical protein
MNHTSKNGAALCLKTIMEQLILLMFVADAKLSAAKTLNRH